MKLRNKKTGEIKECYSVAIFENALGDGAGEYRSITELIENWEDHRPAEPRIEDPKARKIFLEWADLCGAKQFRVSHHDNYGEGKTTSIWSTDIPTEPEIELPGHIGKDSETYTITELCGEERE